MLINRELGDLPISISTSEAIIALFTDNIEKEMPFKYAGQSIWINLRTLYRNLISSIEPNANHNVDMIVSDLKEEIIVLISTLNGNNVKGKNKVILYANSHNSLEKVFPYAKIKRPKTDKQKKFFIQERDVLVNLLKEIKTNKEYSVKKGDYKLEGDDTEAILLTHHPLDLLSRYKFSELYLLESHTGNVKRQNQWNTKLTGGSKNPRMPFNSFTLQVFGDNSTSFYSWSMGYKRVLKDLAVSSNWNSITGSEKIINDVMQVKSTNPVIYDLFKKMMKTKMFF